MLSYYQFFKGYIDLKVDNKDIDAMIAQAKNIFSEEKISPAFKAIFEILITLFAPGNPHRVRQHFFYASHLEV